MVLNRVLVLTCLVSAAAFQTGNRFFTYGRTMNMALSQDELKKMVGYKVFISSLYLSICITEL